MPRTRLNDRKRATSKILRNAGLTESGPFVKLASPITYRNPGAAFSVDQFMLKQRRTSSPRPAAKKKAAARVKPKRKTAAKPARRASSAGRRHATTKPSSKRAGAKAAAKPSAKAAAKPAAARVLLKGRQPVAPAGAASHEHAVETYERGIKALQQRQFDRAATALKAVIAGFPDEKELQERARVYLSICERQAGGAGARPRSFDERVNAATVFINRGALDDGLRLLSALESENPRSDHVQYLLTVAHTSAGDVDKALTHLRRAIELNPENRFLSKSDADLEPLRQHAGFLATFEAPPAASAPRRRAAAKKR